MEEKELANLSVNTRIISVKLNNFSVAAIDKKIIPNLNKDSFAYEYGVQLLVDPPQKQIVVNCLIKIFSELDKKINLAEISSSGTFELLNLDEIVKKFNGVPSFILPLFVGVLLSTSRGFLLLKSEGTIIEGATLPIIDTTTLFSDSSSFETKSL
ncbi:MAG: hypothetical protein ABI763_01490 [Bacteroidota bacterium]